MSVLRNTLGTALGVSAQGLSLVSKVLETTAKTLRPDAPHEAQAPIRRAPEPASPPSPPVGTEAVISGVAADVPQRGRVVEPPATPLLDETPHVRTSESHIEELAAKPAAQVTAAVAGLSTDELRLLTEYEMAHKNRRTVMTAIERALAPTP